MKPTAALLDTDILSEILKGKDPYVVQRAGAYLAAQRQFAFSSITFYEVLRGLKAKHASRQLNRFRAFCAHCVIVPITDDLLEHAADLWVLAQHAGHPKNDADLVIAATAVAQQRILITANTSHFSWVPGLPIENWRKP